jgi:hypothetical protein
MIARMGSDLARSRARYTVGASAPSQPIAPPNRREIFRFKSDSSCQSLDATSAHRRDGRRYSGSTWVTSHSRPATSPTLVDPRSDQTEEHTNDDYSDREPNEAEP